MTILKVVGIVGIVIVVLNFILLIFGKIEVIVFWFIMIVFFIIAWLMKRKRPQ